MIKRINRLASALMDHFSMLIVLFPLMIISFVFVLVFVDSSYPDLSFITNRTVNTILFAPFLVYFLKDSYRGKSIGKRIIGLQVINKSTNKPANSLQCFIRNLLIPIWPLEILILIFSPSRRLGDLIANTKVIASEKENIKTLLLDVKQTKFSINIIAILVIGLSYSYGLSYLFTSLIY